MKYCASQMAPACSAASSPCIPYSMSFRTDYELPHNREIAPITPKCSHNYWRISKIWKWAFPEKQLQTLFHVCAVTHRLKKAVRNDMKYRILTSLRLLFRLGMVLYMTPLKDKRSICCGSLLGSYCPTPQMTQVTPKSGYWNPSGI